MVRVLSGDALRFALARRQHDIDSIGAIGSRAGKEQPSRLVLIVEPLPVLFIVLLSALLFLRQRLCKYDIPPAGFASRERFNISEIWSE